jgi:hypothetical protein
LTAKITLDRVSVNSEVKIIVLQIIMLIRMKSAYLVQCMLWPTCIIQHRGLWAMICIKKTIQIPNQKVRRCTYWHQSKARQKCHYCSDLNPEYSDIQRIRLGPFILHEPCNKNDSSCSLARQCSFIWFPHVTIHTIGNSTLNTIIQFS